MLSENVASKDTINITELERDLASMKLICTVCIVISLISAMPIVVTGLLVKERRTFPSRITTIFLLKIMLMNAIVLFGTIVDYRIPSLLNHILFEPLGLQLMSNTWCKTQAIAYHFCIWCVSLIG